MAGIVHVEDRAEVLVELRREVGDRSAPTGAEEVGPTAGLYDVGVAGDRPVAGTRREDLFTVHVVGALVEEADGLFGAQTGEGLLTVRLREPPESAGAAQVDVVQFHVRALLDAHLRAGAPRSGVPANSA